MEIPRMQIKSVYLPKIDLLKIVLTDEIHRKSRTVYRHLRMKDRTETERELYPFLGCENIFPHENMVKLRSLGVEDFISYTR